MKITMVKKRLANGDFCRKCMQVEELLKKRRYWHRIDEVVLAVEDEPESPGMRLAASHRVEQAPFFIVACDGQDEMVYTSALQLMRDVPADVQGGKLGKGFGVAVQSGGGSPDGLSIDIDSVREELAELIPAGRIEYALKNFGIHCAVAFSGAEDVVLIDMAVKTGLDFSVFSLDTGRLHPETYRFIEKVRDHYGVDIRAVSPAREELEPFVQEKGLYSFYRDGHRECCGIRKVAPLKRTLADYNAWITGQRKDQNPSTRGTVPIIQADPSFTGLHGKTLIKFNPIADWSLNQVWRYIREQQVPYNELHNKGFISIGCEPCTRAIRPGEHERAGRWWWEDETNRECGLHVQYE